MRKIKVKDINEYRLAYLSDGEVNWCEELGTVLANDEVINFSERGGFPVTKKELSIGVLGLVNMLKDFYLI